MNRSDDFVQGFLDRYEAEKALLPGVATLGPLREQAIARFAELGLPTIRIEDWKYTNLARLGRTELASQGTADVSAADIDALRLGTNDAHLLVFVDGRFAPHLSRIDDLGGGVTLAPLADVADDHTKVIEGIGALATLNGNGLVALNTALMRDGPVLRVPRDVAVDRPIHCLYVATGASAAHPRSSVVLERGARATVIESFAGLSGAAGLTNAVAEVDLADGSAIDYVRLQEEGPAARHIGYTRVRLGRDARFDGFVLSTGAALSRNEIRVAIEGEGASCALTGGSLVRGRQHSDITTEIDHRVPHGSSTQLFKNVLDGQARSVFQGRVVVQPQAQKTDAHQTNRNLLLSLEAQADTKPELKIFADDVKCSHGATVGDLDQDALFYLLSRGIDREAARSLLIEAFVAELVDGIGNEAIRDVVRQRIAEWLAAGKDRMEKAA